MACPTVKLISGHYARVVEAMVHELIREDNLAIRLMRDDYGDYEFMAKWLTDPRVTEFYEGRDNPPPFDRIKEKYAPSVLGHDNVVPCLLVFEDTPIGYLQFYPTSSSARLAFGTGASAHVQFRSSCGISFGCGVPRR